MWASPTEGLCSCGCGRPTSRILKSDLKRGLIRGGYRRYCRGHQLRLSPVEYVEQDCGYETPCWVWQLGTTNLGYGRIVLDGKMQSAHRVYYERFVGAIPNDLPLDHLCRNPSCVNPEHLEPVTTAENAQRGVGAKVTPEEVRSIRKRVADGEMQKTLASEFGLAKSTLHQIVHRRTWKNIREDDAA